MRVALIILAVVAAAFVVFGIVDRNVLLDVDYVAGTAHAVSLLWISATVGLVLFLVGALAVAFVRAFDVRDRRKLEGELQVVYERLRAAEAAARRAAPAGTHATAPEVTALAPALAGQSTASLAAVAEPATRELPAARGGEEPTVRVTRARPDEPAPPQGPPSA